MRPVLPTTWERHVDIEPKSYWPLVSDKDFTMRLISAQDRLAITAQYVSVASSTVRPAELLRAVSALGGQMAVSAFEPCPAHVTTGSLAVCCFSLLFRLRGRR